MKRTQITVSLSRVHALGGYCNVKPGVSLTAELDDWDDEDRVRAQLLAEAKAFVEEQIDQALEAEDQPAKFSAAPRYRLIQTVDVWMVNERNFRERKISPPEYLLILLPNDAAVGRVSAQTWWSDVYEGRKLRLGHARTKARQELLDHDRYRLIDTIAGDLVPAWVWEAPSAPPEPEPTADLDPAPVGIDTVWGEEDDEEDDEDDR